MADEGATNDLIDARLKAALEVNNTELLANINSIIDKISLPSHSVQSEVNFPKFKRQSNEEQYRHSSDLMKKLNEAERLIDGEKSDRAKDCIIEAKQLVKERMKHIQMADSSSLGWKVVSEYKSNPLASDSDDEKRILKAESRASRKAKEAQKSKTKKSRFRPYFNRRPAVVSPAAPGVQRQGSLRPGVCFTCGIAGHWKAECTQNRRPNNKISSFVSTVVHNVDSGKICQSDIEEQCKLEHQEVVPVLPNTQGNQGKICQSSGVTVQEPVKSPVGRLKKSFSKWSQITDDKYILNVVENGYKIPFKHIPDEANLRNNKSARDNPDFVKSEIEVLLRKGVISEITEKPVVVNPLTVAFNKVGKPRLVLDCRQINPCLHLFNVKFEDIHVAETMFENFTHAFVFDLKSAYHHIEIFPNHKTYLGFSWKSNDIIKYYVFNCLPFGIASAGHIFTKTLEVVLKYWRSLGHRVIMFLDDGIGGEREFQKAIESSRFVRNSLYDLGFLIAEEKCSWQPVRVVTWLGHVLNYNENRLFITEERISRVEISIDSLLFQCSADRSNLIPVKFLASIVGQIVSLLSVIGRSVCLRTRYLHKCIETRKNWHTKVYVSPDALSELSFWREHVRYLNNIGKSLQEITLIHYKVYTDAGAEGYGGYIEINSSLANKKTDVRGANIDLPEVEFRLDGTDSHRSLGAQKSYKVCNFAADDRIDFSDIESVSNILPEVTFIPDMVKSLGELSQVNKQEYKKYSMVGPYTLPEVSDVEFKEMNWSMIPEVNMQGNIKYQEVDTDALPEVSDIEFKEMNTKSVITEKTSGFVTSNMSCELDRLTESSRFQNPGVDSIKHKRPEVSILKRSKIFSLLNSHDISPKVDIGVPGIPEVVPVLQGVLEVNKCKCSESEESAYISPEVIRSESPEADSMKGLGIKHTLKRKFDDAGVPVEDLSGVVDRMAGHIVNSRANSTVTKYSYEIKHFKQFCDTKGFPTNPALPIHVAMYLSQLIDIGKSDKVISASFYAIKFLHEVNDLPDPTANRMVKNMLECAKRTNSKPVTKRDIISTEHLIQLCDSYTDSVDVIVLRDLAMILLLYSGFLRYSEVSDLRCCDITFKSEYIVLRIRQSKTDHYRSGKDVFVSRGDTSACPVAMLRKYMFFAHLRVDSEMYLFRPACRSGTKCFLLDKNKKLSYSRVREVIVAKLKSVAPNLKLGTHTLRASGATTVANASDNVSERCIKRHGRWKTDTAKDSYIDDSIDKKLHITKQLKL